MSNYYNNNVYPVDAYGRPIDQTINSNMVPNMNSNMTCNTTSNMTTTPVYTTPVYNTPGAGYPTGSEKIVIKRGPDGYETKEKSSFHNPITGVSEKIKSKTKGERDSRSRSRSSSDERRRRVNGGVAPISSGINTTPMYNNAPVMSTAPMMTPVMNSGPMMTSTSGPMMGPGPIVEPSLHTTNMPMMREPLGTHNPIHNPTDLYAHQKGKVVVRDDKVKTVEKMTYVDPVTGMEENAKIKTKVVGDRSRSRSQGKSKTAYDHKTEDTINGPRTVIKEKHREGGIIDNLKNKFHNMTHRK